MLLEERTFKAPPSILPDIQQDGRHAVQAGAQYHIVLAFHLLYLGVPEIKGRPLWSFSDYILFVSIFLNGTRFTSTL